MKCHDINYAQVKKLCDMDTQHFSAKLFYLKQIGYIERVDKSWKITQAGVDALKSMEISSAMSRDEAAKLVSCLQIVSEDLHAMQRCGITPTEKWMDGTCKKIDIILSKNR